MNKPKSHTPGPWRWEVNETCKTVFLAGGRPRHDKYVLSFKRWGMSSATPEFRSPIDNEMDESALMEKARDFAVPLKDREHHKSWFQVIDHPDAKLIAAAPDLLYALKGLAEYFAFMVKDPQFNEYTQALEAIKKATE